LLRRAEAAGDAAQMRAVGGAARMVADARSYAPSDWPYLRGVRLVEGPTAREKQALALVEKGDARGAQAVLETARRDLPFEACDLTVDLAVVLHNAGDQIGRASCRERV